MTSSSPLPARRFRMACERGSTIPRAFTLIELLVVIGIIALLISILLPVLSNARRNAMKLQCLSNLRQIGMAFQTYQADNKGSFPTCTGWNVMGKKGTNARYDNPDGTFTGWVGDRNLNTSDFRSGIRPLNKYLVKKEVAQCPADVGDPRSDIAIPYEVSCYDAWGTSYLVPWQMSVFGVRYVTADPDQTGLSGPTWSQTIYDPVTPHIPMRAGQLKNAPHKILAGDWNWNKNRHIDQPATMWHHKFQKGAVPGVNAQRYMNMLFGDGHAEDFAFPLWYELLNDGGTDAPATIPGVVQIPPKANWWNAPNWNREFW